MKTIVYFAIGRKKAWWSDEEATQTVFEADTLSECLAEFHEQKYNVVDYFIDVWEVYNDRHFPVGEIKIKS